MALASLPHLVANMASYGSAFPALGPHRSLLEEAEEALDCGLSADDGDPHAALGYRIGGLVGILLASLVGFVLPNIFTATRYDFLFFLSRTFSAGVIVAVGIVHIFPEAEEQLSNPCLGFSDFPWGPTIVLFSVLFIFIFQQWLRLVVRKRVRAGCHAENAMVTASTGAGSSITEMTSLEGIEKGLSESDLASLRALEETARMAVLNYRIAAYSLEAGIIFHSVFIGMTLGTSRDVAVAQALTFALLFHQGFEGLALGAVVAKAQMGLWKVIMFGTAFSLTTPLGVAIGIGLSTSYNENNKVYIAFDGIINSIAAGILIYNGLVDLILPVFTEDEEEHPEFRTWQLFGFVSLLMGASSMTLIAKWT